MSLGGSLYRARKNKGLSQEAVAEKLGVSRQTISKWETDEALPDIRQAKRLAVLYGLSLDELIDFDLELQEIQAVIDNTSGDISDRIDWTKAWSKKYPVLAQYQDRVETAPYVSALRGLLDDLRSRYGYSELDAFLVLKDILALLWKARGERPR